MITPTIHYLIKALKTAIVIGLASVVLYVGWVGVAAAGSASRYSAFGNDSVNDCGFVAYANLIQRDWPTTPLTTAEVVSAWRDTPGNILTFMAQTGFSGHYVVAETPLTTQAEFMAAASSGGVYAFVTQDPQGQNLGLHAVAVVGVNAKGPLVVWWGQAERTSWRTWRKIVALEYSLTWSDQPT